MIFSSESYIQKVDVIIIFYKFFLFNKLSDSIAVKKSIKEHLICSMRNKLYSNLGYTLMELMVTIGIAGILAGMAVPNFIGTIRSNRLTTQVNEFVSALNLARNESVKRGKMVVVRKTGTNWENGWQVFVDIDRSTTSKENVFNDATPDTLCEAGVDCLLRVYQGLSSSQYTLRSTEANYIRFAPTGGSNAAASFVICDNTDGNNLPEPYTAKLITTNSTGRIGMAGDDDNDGIPNKSGGSEITSCITSPFT